MPQSAARKRPARKDEKNAPSIDEPILDLVSRRANRETVLADALDAGDPKLAAAGALLPVRAVVSRLLDALEGCDFEMTGDYWQLLIELDELVGASEHLESAKEE